MIRNKKQPSQATGQAVGSKSLWGEPRSAGGTVLLVASEPESESGRGREEEDDDSYDLNDLLLDEAD